jgi:hypothetical protein
VRILRPVLSQDRSNGGPDRGKGLAYTTFNTDGMNFPNPQEPGNSIFDNGFRANVFHLRDRNATTSMTKNELTAAKQDPTKTFTDYSRDYLRGANAFSLVTAKQPSAASTWNCDTAVPANQDCDEFPFASTFQGGVTNLVTPVGFLMEREPSKLDLSRDENRLAGLSLARFYTQIRVRSATQLFSKAQADLYGVRLTTLSPTDEPELRYVIIAPKTCPLTLGYFKGVFLP